MSIASLTLLIGVLLGASPLVYLLGRLAVRLGWGMWLARGLALLAALAAWAPFVALWQQFAPTGTRSLFFLGNLWMQVDALSLLLAGMTLTLGTLVILFSGAYMAGETGEEKYYAMLLAMMGLIIGLGSAGDLFNLWVWFEAMAVSSYLLVAFYREQPASLEAGMKYLTQSAVGSVLALLGIAVVLGQTGSLDLDQVLAVARTAENQMPLLAAGALFLVGFGVKAALVPLHTWLPDAHSQAPSGISAMLSGVVIQAGLVAMLRALAALAGQAVTWGALLLFFGALNMLLGNLLALRQTQVKRMLAFSSLSHMGYILLGFGAAWWSGSAAGAQGAMFHLFTHMLMKGLAFLSVGALMFALFHHAVQQRPLVGDDLNGAAARYPMAALALSVSLLALAGLPPLAGFMSKWQIFVAGFQTGDGMVMGLVVFAAFNSVLSLGYYAPLVNRLYRRTPSVAVGAGGGIPWTMQVPLVILTLAVFVLGLFPAIFSG